MLSVAVLLCALLWGANAHYLDSPVQRLNAFKEKYNNSQSDIIFLLDTSCSVPYKGFDLEKKFVNNLLDLFSVAPYSTRVTIVTFGERVVKNIDYIDLVPGGNSLPKTKCTFRTEFAGIRHRCEGYTYMKGAYERVDDMLHQAINVHKVKRTNVNTVLFMITDGHWNSPYWRTDNYGNPITAANALRSKYHVELFSVGVGYASPSQLRVLADSQDHVIYVNSFQKFGELATYIRGGTSCSDIIAYL